MDRNGLRARNKRILIASDAWFPQVNGVVRALSNTIKVLEAQGHATFVVHPDLFPSIPCPVYPEISLAFARPGRIRGYLERFAPDHVHIATEGPIGLVTRHICKKQNLRFSTSFHTMFPEYAKKLACIPEHIGWGVLRRFHADGVQVMVPTASIEQKLESFGFKNIRRWSRGIDTAQFHPRPKSCPLETRPILMYVGRVSREKNLEAFLSLRTPGTKYIVGDGPFRKHLERKYPEAVFLGYKRGEALAQAYAEADVFVFPSLTDTFGNVILEALASGVPVAAFPAPGPIDILVDKRLGSCNDSLVLAIEETLAHGIPEYCVEYASSFTWENCSKQFLENLVPMR